MVIGSSFLELAQAVFTAQNVTKQYFALCYWKNFVFDFWNPLFIGSQLAKLKSVFLPCYCHEINRVEAAGLKIYNYA